MPSALSVLWIIYVILMAIFITYGIQWIAAGNEPSTASLCTSSDVSYGECVLATRIKALNAATLLHDTVAFGAGSAVAFWSAIICTILSGVRR